MKTFKTEGIIIKRKNVGEADRILTVFTRSLGKVQMKAVGVRRITSRRSSHTELLNVGTFSLYQGKSLPLLTEVQTTHNFTDIKTDLTKIGFAYHICELVDGLCAENQEQQLVFTLLLDTLQKAGDEDDIATLGHTFEVELLTTLGFWNEDHERPSHSQVHHMIENILERKLKTKNIFSKFN